ncbi:MULTISPECIES: hypothetical protein [unclassified Sphingomonas]|uniref:hypothetical protein n=1 Tax=unclassified Sphingomonas TaxID=196159 RepID=UPI0006F972B5|nr:MULTISPECIES: hypothetical protein [unclassified Sphingomonas]KQS49757.1 hypothetical protein ASG20_12420 [Sphingomonas sp. Leaf198]
MAKRVGVAVKQTYTVVTGGSHRVVQVRRVRPNGWTPAKRKRFLIALSMTCNVTSSSAAVGMNRHSASELKRRDPLFAAQWAEALTSGYERLEEGLLAAAIAGLHEATALREGRTAIHDDEVGDIQDDIDAGVGTDIGDGFGGGFGSCPGSGIVASLEPATRLVPLAGMQAVQVALALLARRAAGGLGSGGQRGRGRKPYRRATQAETDASIANKLDSLARRLRASAQGGEA